MREAGDRVSSNTITDDHCYLWPMENVIDIWMRIGKKLKKLRAASGDYESTPNTYHD